MKTAKPILYPFARFVAFVVKITLIGMTSKFITVNFFDGLESIVCDVECPRKILIGMGRGDKVVVITQKIRSALDAFGNPVGVKSLVERTQSLGQERRVLIGDP